MKKILLITYYWPPCGGAGVQRTLKFAKFFSEFGIEPIVLTVDDKFASYPLRDESLLRDVHPNLQIVKTKSLEPLKLLSFVSGNSIPHGGFANKDQERLSQKMLRFIRGNLFIPDARIGWVRFAKKAAAAIIQREKIDAVLISSPPHSSQLIGLWLKEKFGIRWIADLRDPWTDIYYYKDLLHTSLASRIDKRYERKVLERCDAALVVSPSIQKMFASKSNKIDANKIHVVPNGYDEDDFKDVKANKDEKVFRITYVGSMAGTYAPEIFFQCLMEILGEHKEVKIKLRFVGHVSGEIYRSLEKYGLISITEFISYLPHSKAIEEMNAASMLLLIIPNVKDAEGILTGKLFEYLGAEKPVVGLGPSKGDAAGILHETGSGKMFDRSEPEKIKEFILLHVSEWKDKKSFQADKGKIQKYSRRKQSEAVAKLLLNLT